MQTGPQTLTLHNEQIRQQYLACIIQNRTNDLRVLAQQYDPNLVFGTKESILNFANYFGRTECAEVLVDNGADQSFANELDLVKQFGHVFNLRENVETKIRLKDGRQANITISEEHSSPSAGLLWAKQRFNTASQKDPKYQIIADAFNFASNTDNYTLSNLNNPNNFVKRISENPDQITAIPSGYTSHNIGIMFYKGNMIVSDGTGDIQVYKVDPKKITSDDIKNLLAIRDQATYHSTIAKITDNNPPTVLKYKAQTANNCCYRNFVSAIEGVFYIDKLQQSMNASHSEQLARDELKKFNKLDKMEMVESLAKKISNGEIDKKVAFKLLNDYFSKVKSKGTMSENAIKRINILLAAFSPEERAKFVEKNQITTASSGHIENAQNTETEVFSNNIRPITPLQNTRTTTPSSTIPIVLDQNTTLKQLCDYMDAHKEKYRYAEKQSAWNPAQKSLEVSFLADGKIKSVGYVNENPDKGISYSVSKHLKGSDLADSIDSICELAVKNYKEGTAFDLSNTAADKLPLVQASLEKHIKLLKDSGIEETKLPKIIFNNPNASKKSGPT